MASTPSDPQPDPAAETGGAASYTPVVDSESLFRGHSEVLILHGDQTYRLRITRSGKLILQK